MDYAPGPDPGPVEVSASVDSVAPGGQCVASGTIAVSGGEYPMNVHYQWVRVALINGNLAVDPVSPVHSVDFSEPGSRNVVLNYLPEDGPNVRIVVSAPTEVSSPWVGYDGCGGQPGGLTGS
jgi:hypothetical protein